MPVYKLATIYNPVWTSNSAWGKSDATYLSYSNETLGEFKGQCQQWDLATNNDFDVTFEEAGEYTFTSQNGIFSEWWGSPLGADITANGSGEPNLNAPVLKDWFSTLPSFTVSVKKDVPVENITLDQETLELQVGDVSSLQATVTPADATNQTVEWSSDHTDVVIVDQDGVLNAVSAGKAVITAKAGEKTATCEVTVKEKSEQPEKTPVGTVTVSIQDMIPTPDGEDWPEAKGVILDNVKVSIYEDDTMLDAIERACVENNIEISFDSNKTYVTGIDGLEQLERGEKSGWFVTLNGWFTDDGAGNFTVANGKFADGDIVTMEYSLDYGNDLTDTTDVTGELKSLGINTGELAPQYSRDVYEYTLTIPKDTKQVSFAPESFNRYDKITIQSNGNEYRYGAAIPVEEGTIVNITSVPVSYTTPVEPDAKVTYQVTVKNEDDSQNPDPEKPDPQEPEKEEITLTDTQYGVSLTGKELTKDMQLVVSKLTKDDAAVDEIRKAIPSSKGVFALYHVELRQDGKEVALSDTAKLSLPVGKKYNGNTMDVLLYTGGEVKKLSGTVTDGYITVKVTQLGDFGVVTDMAGDGASTTDKLSSADGSGNSQTGTVKTGDSVKIEYLVYLIAACAVVITAVVVVKKKRQGK